MLWISARSSVQIPLVAARRALFLSVLAALTLSGQTAAMAAGEEGALSCFDIRAGLRNARWVFESEKAARVAYMGGSITASPGWRDQVCAVLQQRFPGTVFDFINAGVGGTNSTAGAFRFERDVFGKGKVDLLFLEFAVNDDGGDGPDNRSPRAIEGIVRHARALNPGIDILMLHFADEEKVETIKAGVVPYSIAEHEKVASHYGIPSIDLASEVTRRIQAGAFVWEDFSRDSCHPHPMGHDLYAACVATLLDTIWKEALPADGLPAAYPMPPPLDTSSYERGRLIDVHDARIVSGWEHVQGWVAEKTCNYGGPVHVLAATAAGATLELDFEGAVIGVSAIAGMDAGIIEYRIDEGEPCTLNLFDHYCTQFHRPVCRILAEDLPPGKHRLTLTIGADTDPQSEGHVARIRAFVAN